MSREPSASFARSAPEGREAWLILVVTGVLTLFTYLARADLLGTARPGGELFSLAGPALGLGRHNLAAAILLGWGVLFVDYWLRNRTPATAHEVSYEELQAHFEALRQTNPELRRQIMGIYQSPGANALQVADRVRAEVARLIASPRFENFVDDFLAHGCLRVQALSGEPARSS